MPSFIKVALKILFAFLIVVFLWNLSPWVLFLVAFCVLFAKVIAPAADKMMMKIGEM